MPYAPGISYRGDQFLYQGLTSAVERMDRERERAKQDKKLFDSYVTQGEALGLNPDVMKVQSLGSVAGMVEGEKLKRMREMQMAQMAHMETQDASARQRMEWEPRMQAALARHYAQQDESARQQQARAEAAARNQQAFGEAVWELASRPNTAGAEAGAEALNAVAAGMGGVPSVQGSDLVGMLPPRKAEPQEILGLMARYGQPLSAADDVGKLLGAGAANQRNWAPQPFSVALPSGKTVEGIYSPGTGAYSQHQQPTEVFDALGQSMGFATSNGRIQNPALDIARRAAVEGRTELDEVNTERARKILGMLNNMLANNPQSPGGTAKPAAKPSAAPTTPPKAASSASPLRSVSSPDQLQVGGNDVTARRRAAFKAEWEKNPSMTQEQADDLIARLKREIK